MNTNSQNPEVRSSEEDKDLNTLEVDQAPKERWNKNLIQTVALITALIGLMAALINNWDAIFSPSSMAESPQLSRIPKEVKNHKLYWEKNTPLTALNLNKVCVSKESIVIPYAASLQRRVNQVSDGLVVQLGIIQFPKGGDEDCTRGTFREFNSVFGQPGKNWECFGKVDYSPDDDGLTWKNTGGRGEGWMNQCPDQQISKKFVGQ